MDFIADQGALVGALKAGTTVAEREASHGLSAVLLTGFGESVTVASTDFNMVLTQSVDAKVGTPGKMALNAKKIWSVVSKYGKGDVSFRHVTVGRIEVTSGASTFNLAAYSADAFPKPPDKGTYVASLELPALDLAELIKGTIFSACRDFNRVNIAGICFSSPEPGTLRLVSTDGHRLSYIDRAIGGDFHLQSGVLVPLKAMQVALDLLKRHEGNVRLDFGSLCATLTVGRSVMTSRLVEAELPDYRGVIPKSFKYEAVVDARAFARAVDRVSLVANRVNRGVDITFEQGRLHMRTADVDEGGEIVSATCDAPNITLTLDAASLQDALKVIRNGNVWLKLNDNRTPLVMVADKLPTFFHLMMPQRPSGQPYDRKKQKTATVTTATVAPVESPSPEIQAEPPHAWRNLALLEWKGGERNRALGIYFPPEGGRIIGASDAVGSGFSVGVESDDLERLDHALHLPRPKASEAFTDDDYVWHFAHHGLTVVSCAQVTLPELLGFLLRAKSRFATELKVECSANKEI